jgi:ATP-binding cassette, subfamily B (MDR/TAP), member 1
VISEGKTVEQGTHQELIDLKGRYSALVLAQDLGGKQVRTSHTPESSDDPDDEKAVFAVARTKTDPGAGKGEASQYDALETMNYSLLKCIAIMFAEQKALYPMLCIAVFSCVVGGGVYPAQAIIFSRVIDVFKLEGSEATSKANFWTLMFFVIALANLFAYFTLAWLSNAIGQKITHRYRLEMFERVLSLDLDFFDLPHNTSGALTSKLSAMPEQLQELMSFNIFLILIIFVNIIASSTLALVYGWKLALAVIFGGLLPLVLAGFFRVRLEMKLETENEKRFAESAGLASEAVTSIRTVASLALEGEILKEFSEMLGKIVSRSIKKTLWTMLWFSASQSLYFLVMALGFWYGSQLVALGEYTTTQFYVIFIGILFAGQAAGQFFGWTSSFTKAVGAANYTLWLRTLKPVMSENESNQGRGPETDDDGDINFNHVSFKYPSSGSARVLRDISMTVSSPNPFPSTSNTPDRSNPPNLSPSSVLQAAANQPSSPS